MAFSPSAACLVAGLVLLPTAAGCDRLTDAPAAPGMPALPDALPGMYVKGAAALPAGAPLEYRAQAVPGAVSYGWSAVGAGFATIESRGNSRLAALTGERAGPIELHVTAYDAREVALARGERALVVTE